MTETPPMPPLGREAEDVIATVRAAFATTEYPGDPFLQGSFEGCEPYEEAEAFKGKLDWASLEPEFLDAHYTALSFLSEGGLRYFLPAFLIADVRGRLLTADPLFHLTSGFLDRSMDCPVGGRVFVRRWGRAGLVNPRRYGALTWYDYARHRLAVFTREEAAAIVAYLRWKRPVADIDEERAAIDAALEAFWLERARTAPTAESLRRHLAEEQAFMEAVQADHAERAARANPPPG